LQPDIAQGAWARAPRACNHTSVSGALNSCGMMVQVDEGPGALAAPISDIGEPSVDDVPRNNGAAPWPPSCRS
jgi:hypothetical protein